VAECLFQLLAPGGPQVDALVKVFDLVLYGLGQGGAEGAVWLFPGVAAQADEVLVGGLLGSGGGDDQA